MRVDNYTAPKVEPKPVVKPEVKPQAEVQTQTENTATKTGEQQFTGSVIKAKLEKQLDEKITPYEALNKIDRLPQPAADDTEAIREYKKKRADIADQALRNAQPPKLEDFRNTGLNGRTADYEYQQALQSYNEQVKQLKGISTEAKTYPNKILTPGEAKAEIDKLPRPDRNNPAEIAAYNQKAADIADAALMYKSEPPKRENFPSSRFGAEEYQDAVTNYNNNLKALKDISQNRYSPQPPPITDAESNKAADDLINARGGANGVSEDEAYDIGKKLAEIAADNPEDATAIMKKVQEKLNGTDKGDNVADGFVKNSSDGTLQKIAKTYDGKEMLKDLQHRLLTGNVHDNERADAKKIDYALYPKLKEVQDAADRILNTHDGKDGQRLADELKKLDAEGQKALMKELADRDPQRLKEILIEAGGEGRSYSETGRQVSDADQKVIANALGEAYKAGMLPSVDGKDFAHYLAYGAGYEAAHKLGNLIGEADSANARDFKVAYAKECLKAGTDDDYFGPPNDATAAGIRAIANDPAALAEVLGPYQRGKVNGQSLTDILKLADLSGNGAGLPSALSKVLDTAAGLPASQNDLSLAIFRSCVRDMPEAFDGERNADKANALGRFFQSHSEFLSLKMNDVDATIEDQKTFSRFVELTVFNKDCSESENVKQSIVDVGKKLRDEALKYDPTKPDSYNQDALAASRTLGTLSGNLFNGYFLRVQDIQKDNAENRAFLKSLVDMALDFVPFGKIAENLGGSEVLKKVLDLGVNQTKEQLSDSIVDTIFSGEEADTLQNLQDFIQNIMLNLPEGETKQEAIQNQRIAIGLFGVYDLLPG